MLKNRKLLSVILVLMLALTLTACQEEAKPAPAPAPAPAPEKTLDPATVRVEEAAKLMSIVGEVPLIIRGNDFLDKYEVNPDAFFVVDLRAVADYEAGHIDGAVNIPFAELGDKWAHIPQDKEVYFVCYSGQTSAQATAVARMLGYEAFSFFSGMKFGWPELGRSDDELKTDKVALPEAVELELTPEQAIMMDFAKDYFGDIHIISPQDLLDRVEVNPDGVYVLDIRKDDAFEAGRVQGAVHVNYGEVHAKIGELPKDKPVYVICYTGQTAGITTGALRMAGLDAHSLNRGMTGWDGAELPKVTE